MLLNCGHCCHCGIAGMLTILFLETELQKSHGCAGITREEGLQNGQSMRKVSCQHTT